MGLFLDRFCRLLKPIETEQCSAFNLSESNVSFSTENRKAHLSVIAENCPALTRVPPSFCKYNNSLKTLTLGNGTRASFVLDWSNQLRHGVAVEINDACEGAWKGTDASFGK